MVYDPAKFRQGDLVKIADADVLDEFARTWKYHHRLHPDQIAYAGRTARVKESYMYHGGDILYELEGVPGIWHERLLARGNS